VKVVVTDVAAIALLLLHTRTGEKPAAHLVGFGVKSFGNQTSKGGLCESSTYKKPVLALAASNC